MPNILNHNNPVQIWLDRVKSERLGHELEAALAAGLTGETSARVQIKNYWTTTGVDFSARGGEVKFTYYQVTTEDVCV